MALIVIKLQWDVPIVLPIRGWNLNSAATALTMKGHRVPSVPLLLETETHKSQREGLGNVTQLGVLDKKDTFLKTYCSLLQFIPANTQIDTSCLRDIRF